jgi:outer membrane protein assembly factor BamB
MSVSQTHESNPQKPLRLWPGVLAVVLQWLAWIGLPIVAPDNAALGLTCGILLELVVLVWWAFFSRVPHAERWGALLLFIVAAAVTPQIPGLLHPSIPGMMFGILVIPGLCLALVGWTVLSRFLGAGPRRLALALAILTACGFWTLMRSEGVTGGGHPQIVWRWKQSAEDQLLTRVGSEPAAIPAAVPAPATPAETPAAPKTAPAAPKPALPETAQAPNSHIDWPGFRGPHRDSVVPGVRIETDWSASPPKEMWRRPVGPGWSSFAVGDGRIYTQEQRGEFEVVASYNAATGKPAWTHRDAIRFYDPGSGAGPRGTPALQGGRVYALGATGILNALDARSGAVVWTRNAASDTGAKRPDYGFSGSPLVVDDLVIVATSGRLAAYDRSTGAPRWIQKEGRGSYSSPQLLTIGGVAQIVLLNGAGTNGVAPADGKVLWTHPWPEPGISILQPALTADGGLLSAEGDMMRGKGVLRLAIANGPSGWTVAEVWTSRGLKPYFNDFVVHNGHGFGFDGSILSCIDLKDGQRKWKGGRYGNGQLVLLADQDLLLVLSEEGELALVGATPDQFKELARVPAINGKTWNHPVLVGDELLVRNGQEMAAFRLALAH